MPAGGAVESPASVDSLRGANFRALIREPLVVALIGLGALAVGLGVGSAVGAALGAIAAICAALFGLVPAYLLARRRARQEFFAAFARDRGLELVEESLPEVTPLLYAGSERATSLALRGELGEGLIGTVAHYTYIEHLPGGRGASSAAAYKLTIVLIEVPGVRDAFPRLLCHGRVGSQRTDALDDAFRGPRTKRLELESEALDRRFEIFFDRDQDEVRLRRLFSPSFVVWLAESMPTAFELVNGNLCCSAGGHLDSAAELDAVTAGAVELVRRLQAEATE